MKLFSRFVLAVAVCGVSTLANAQIFNLTSLNTTATVEASTTMGLRDWTLNGTDQVFRSTYLWRVGDTGNADFIGNLNLISSSQPTSDFLDLTYENATLGFRVNVKYILTGGATQFDLAEIVSVTNTGNGTLDFRLFQYNDFDLNETSANDTVTRLNSSQFQQQDGAVALNVLFQSGTPLPPFSELGDFSTLLNSIDATNGYFLDTPAGGGIGQSHSGDAAYAFMWTQTLAPGQNMILSTDKVAAVPEPASMAALGLGALALLRRRKKSK